MVPNVIGMGLNADGGLIATKPYISSANYIHRMSDYGGDCRFNHKQHTGDDACPFNFLIGAICLSTEPACRPIPDWAVTCWASATWMRTSGERYAARLWLFLRGWTTRDHSVEK